MPDSSNRTFVVAHSVVGPVMPMGDRRALPPRYKGETFPESEYEPDTITRLLDAGAIKDASTESGQAIATEGVNPNYIGGMSVEQVFPHLVKEAIREGRPVNSIEATGAAALGIRQTMAPEATDANADGVPDAPRRGPGRPPNQPQQTLPPTPPQG